MATRSDSRMATTPGDETEAVHQFLESTLESVDGAETLVIEAAAKAGMDEEDQHKIGMAVRECMVNAVVHGNRYNAHKKVRLTVTVRADRFLVRIADEGEGFDVDALPDPVAEGNLLRHSGRGIFLIRAFTDDFQVRRASPTGTEVTLVKNLGA